MAEKQNRTLKDQYMLRLPDGMRDRIKAVADENSRSMNAEIVATLEEKYPAPVDEVRMSLEDAQRLRRLIEQLAETDPATQQFWEIKGEIDKIMVMNDVVPEHDQDIGMEPAPEMR